MTRDRFLPWPAIKDFRALLPVWAAILMAVVAAAWGGDPAAASAAYAIGCIVIGAQSMGHEYTHRTLAVLMSQPSPRWRVFLTKIATLASLLLALSAVAWTVLVSRGQLPPAMVAHRLMMWGPLLSGLLLAPWLTMICRSAIGGVVFSLALPALVLLAAQLAAATIHGGAGPSSDPFGLSLWSRAMLVLYATAAAMSWRTFARLEAMDGNGPDVRMPQWIAAQRQARKGRRLSILIRKELHLQQLTFVLVVLYAIGWLTIFVLTHLVPALGSFPLGPLTVLYLMILSVLVGALPSAEERQFGMLEWQLLLPMPAWQQWGVKAGVAIGLALILGLGVPGAFWLVSGGNDDLALGMAWGRMAMLVVLVTSCSLYVSSLCASGMRAMVWSVPVVFASLWLIVLVDMAAWLVLPHLAGTDQTAVAARVASVRALRSINDVLTLGFGARLRRHPVVAGVRQPPHARCEPRARGSPGCPDCRGGDRRCPARLRLLDAVPAALSDPVPGSRTPIDILRGCGRLASSRSSWCSAQRAPRRSGDARRRRASQPRRRPSRRNPPW